MFIALIFPHALHGASGDLDPSFGSAGKVTTKTVGPLTSIVLQPDGRIVVAGQVGADFNVARYNSDGSLDPTFGIGGQITINLGAHALALQPDGKIVVAGAGPSISNPFDVFRSDAALARYNPDGTLDATFGSGGRVSTHFSDADASLNSDANALSLQPDGKIVATVRADAVPFFCLRDCSAKFLFVLIRYNPDGSLDRAFGSVGTATLDLGPNALALQPDGKFVVAGEVGSDFAVARYNPDGNRDPTFASGGTVTTDFGATDFGNALTVEPDGKIVVVGESNAGGVSSHFALARYNPDGSLDPTFGSGGKVATVFSGRDVANALALQRDGKFIVAGHTGILAVPGDPLTVVGSDFAVARYNPDGSLDQTFGTGGKVTTDFGNVDFANALALQPDGRILVAGSTAEPPFFFHTAALARYQGGGPTAAAGLNGSAFRTGQTITYEATLIPDSTPTQVDIYLGALLPDGVMFLSLVQSGPGIVSVVLGSAPVAFLTEVTLPPLRIPFAFTFTGAEPGGTYFTYAGLAVAGSNPFLAENQLSLAIQTFQFTP